MIYNIRKFSQSIDEGTCSAVSYSLHSHRRNKSPEEGPKSRRNLYNEKTDKTGLFLFMMLPLQLCMEGQLADGAHSAVPTLRGSATASRLLLPIAKLKRDLPYLRVSR